MICIFSALYKEALPIIEKYSLTVCNDYAPYKAYSNEKIIVFITGVGKTKCASSIGYFIGKCKDRIDFVINLGICAGNEIGECFVVNSITDSATDRRFYPDMLIRTDLKERSLTTVDSVVTSIEENDMNLYDMEGSSFLESALIHLSPSEVSLIKIVSDKDGEGITPDTVYNLVNSHIDLISAYIDRVFLMLEDRSKLSRFNLEIEALTSKYESVLYASEYMRNELKTIIRYFVCAGIDFEMEISKYMPIESRREGKKVLEALYERLI